MKIINTDSTPKITVHVEDLKIGDTFYIADDDSQTLYMKTDYIAVSGTTYCVELKSGCLYGFGYGEELIQFHKTVTVQF